MSVKPSSHGSGRSLFFNEIRKNKVAYAYISPFYILFAIFGLFPIISGFFISFFNWNGLDRMRFIGLRNYIELLQDNMFWKALYNTFAIGIISHIPILFGGLILAYILNSKIIKFENIFKTMYFLPMVTSAVAVTVVFKAIFGFNAGLLNYALSSMGFEKINWLGGTGAYIKPAVIIMFAWKWIGWNMVIYLAGMQGISHDVYEAATIDGASHLNVFFRITLPILKPIVFFTLIQSTIGMMSLFTEPFVLTNSIKGGMANQGLTIMMYMLDKAPYGSNLYGYASSVAYVICLVIILVSLININTIGRDDDKVKRRRYA